MSEPPASIDIRERIIRHMYVCLGHSRCWLGWLASDLGMSEQQCVYYLNQLVQEGYVCKQVLRQTKNYSFRSRKYTLTQYWLSQPAYEHAESCYKDQHLAYEPF